MLRRVYRAIGGHEAVRNEIAEDLGTRAPFQARRALSYRARRRERTRARAHVPLVARIWEGFVKNFLGRRARSADLSALGIALLACISPLTPLALIVALVLHAEAAAVALGLAMLCAIAGAWPGMRRLGLGRWSSWYLPFGIALVVAIFLTSVVRMRAAASSGGGAAMPLDRRSWPMLGCDNMILAALLLVLVVLISRSTPNRLGLTTA